MNEMYKFILLDYVTKQMVGDVHFTYLPVIDDIILLDNNQAFRVKRRVFSPDNPNRVVLMGIVETAVVYI